MKKCYNKYSLVVERETKYSFKKIKEVFVMRRINKRKLKDEVIMLVLAILGIVIFICNMTKTVPGLGNPIAKMVSCIIAYGFWIGPGVTLLALLCFWDIRNTKYPRKRAR